MERCATCKHWMGEPEMRQPEGWGMCALTFSRLEGSEPPEQQTLAYALDQYAAYESVLWTSPDFGCVQHEPISPGKR